MSQTMHFIAVARRCWLGLAALLLGALLTGCLPPASAPYTSYTLSQESPNLSVEISAAAKRLLDVNPSLPQHGPMIATTFVDINDLRASSTFGRISAELFASALAQAGIHMREVKMRDSLFIEERLGELMLSRNVRRLRDDYAANSVLVGTYARGENRVYVSARVVRTRDAVVLATADFSLRLDNNLRSMLAGRAW
ncbi:MAG: FlgO family outer membrane protein [Halochromatium sp.]|uniref:FlgO family outer membrane protein n=1 Tax=Halochromatium sp. TaxID=2049430 RepID=UPI003979D136